MSAAIRPTQPPRPSDQSPRGAASDLEAAILDLMAAANEHSFKTGRTPELDEEAEAYRIHHGPVPALIHNPTQLALATAIRVLMEHGQSTMAADDFAAMLARIEQRAARIRRYAPDTGVRH